MKTDDTCGSDLDLCLTQGFLSQEKPSLFDGSPKQTPDLKKLSAPAIPKNVAIDNTNSDSIAKSFDPALKPALKPAAHLSQLMEQMSQLAGNSKREEAPVPVTAQSAPRSENIQAAPAQATDHEEPSAKRRCFTKPSTKPGKAPLPAADRSDRVRACQQNYKSAAATFAGGVVIGSVGLMGALLAIPESWFP